MSTYSTNLALELIGTGEQAGTWGNTTNTNLGTLIEQAISGYVTQAVATGTDTTLTIPNGATGVARNMYIELTGTGGTNTNLIVPSNKKLYFIYNNSTGAVTVKVSGQTGVSVAATEKKILVSNGTDIVEATTYFSSVGGSLNLTTLTATSATITTLSGTAVNYGSATISTGNLIVSSGNVGIGTSSPAVQVHATGVGRFSQLQMPNNAGTYTSGSAGFHLFGFSDNNLYFNWFDAGAIVFRNNGTSERMRIDSSGNVGIGTASPQSKLNVVESSSSTSIGGSTAVLQVGNSNGAALNLTAGIELFGSGAPSSGLNNRSAGLYGVYEAYNASGNAGALVLATNPAGTTSVVERMRIDSSGNVGIGGAAGAGEKVTVTGTLPLVSGFSFGYLNLGTIPSGATTLAVGYFSRINPAAASFTLTNLRHFMADQSTFGAGSTATNQFGFYAESSLTGATNNYGFYSAIDSGSNRWNFYAGGTARNYFAGGVEDAAGNLRNIPSAGAAKTSAYTLSISDIGEFVTVGSGGSITVPNDVFAAGNAVSIYNDTTGNISINCPITTAYLAGTNTDRASLTLATRGIATVLFINPSLCVASGNLT